MKPSDLIHTSEEQAQAANTLIQTELTDAVNSGLVENADKSARSLKSDLYTVGSKAATGGAGSAALAAVTKGRKADAADAALPEGHDSAGSAEEMEAASTTFQGKRHLSGKFKTMAKGAAVGTAVNSLTRDTEIDGIDGAYYKTKGAVRLTKAIKRRLSGKDAIQSDKPLGALAEKGSQQKALSAVEAGRKAQSARYLKETLYATKNTVTMRQAAANAIKASINAVRAAGSSALSAIAAASAPVLGVILTVLIGLLLLAAISGGAAGGAESQSFGNLSGVQLEVAQALADAGLAPTQIAAVMGNISGESSWDPTAENHGDGTHYEYGYGLFQFTDTTEGSGNYTNFANWCAANGMEVSSATAQTQYFISVLPNSWSTALHRSGYYTKYITEHRGKDASYDTWLSTNDLSFATYAFMACYERPDAALGRDSFYDTRLPAAESFYAQLTSSGSGQDYAAANETQRAIVDAANRTPFTGSGWCAAWVSNVFANAGLGSINGNACDMYRAYCHSTDRSELQVGMLVAVESSSSGTAAGRIYGHVGIYIGDNLVMHNAGSGVETTDLDAWIATYCQWSPVGWGYPSNVAQ